MGIFMRNGIGKAWDEVGQLGHDLCSPKVQYIVEESRFVLHAKSCSGGYVSIYSFRR